MVKIKISKGLDIPIAGKPIADPQYLRTSGDAETRDSPKQLALNVEEFDLKFHLLAKIGDRVKLGEPILQDKKHPGCLFVSPGGGILSDIQRGAKRSLRTIVIDLDTHEESFSFAPLDPERASREELLERLQQAGMFSKIRKRPFDLLADPDGAKAPRAIFVKAIETAPFVPPAELQVHSYESHFQKGLTALSKMTSGAVHFVYKANSTCQAFINAKQVQKHTVEGPHPAGNVSLHIQEISPIQGPHDIIWVLNAHDVTSIGHLLTEGKIRNDRIVSIAGPGILPDRTGYFRLREGYPIAGLISGRLGKGPMRLISGNPLMGHQVEQEGFLGFSDDVFCVIPENTEREFLHFFRLGTNKYSFSRAYLTGHLNNTHREYEFTTNQHGEHRPFIDSSLYDKVQPLNISTLLLVKAIMAEDYESAEQLGLFDIAPEDFALPTFVCPSKMEMVDIVQRGLLRYIQDLMH